LRLSPFPTRVFTLTVCTNTAEESKPPKKVRFRAARAPESVCKGKLNYQKERKKMTLLTELKDKTASLVRPMTTAMTSMLLLSILASSSSGGTNDGVLNFSNMPSAGNSTLQHQPGRRERGLLQRRERCVSRFPAYSGRCDHYLRCPGCGHRSRRGYLRWQHQSGGGNRGTLRGRQ